MSDLYGKFSIPKSDFLAGDVSIIMEKATPLLLAEADKLKGDGPECLRLREEVKEQFLKPLIRFTAHEAGTNHNEHMLCQLSTIQQLTASLIALMLADNKVEAANVAYLKNTANGFAAALVVKNEIRKAMYFDE